MAELTFHTPLSFVPRHRRVLAVCGAENRSGATTIAVALAASFGLSGERVLLVDGDPGPGGMTGHLGPPPEPDLDQVLAGAATLNQAVSLHADGGFELLQGSGLRDCLAEAPARIVQVLGEDLAILANRYDRVILDMGTAKPPVFGFLVRPEDHILAVGLENDAVALLDLLARLRADGFTRDPGVVINKATSHWAGERVLQTLRRTLGTHAGAALALGRVVRADPALPHAQARAQPLPLVDPEGPAGQDLDALADRIWEAGLEAS